MPKTLHPQAQILLALCFGTLSFGLSAQDLKKPPFFPNKSRIIWLGDSITHQGLYSRFIEDFLYSRYPRRQLLFVNCGVNGDRSGDALNRFNLDVAPWHPTKVFVCLGMNDGGFSNKGIRTLPLFQRNIRSILQAIKGLGAQAILLSPPPVDPQVFLKFGNPPPMEEPLRGYNLVLERFTSLLEKIAQKNKIPFVDLHASLEDYNRRLKFQNPGASLIPDGIHPGNLGSALIAMTILSSLGEKKERLRLRFGKNRMEAHGADVRQLHYSKRGLSFELRAHALPWVLPEEARGAAVLDRGYLDFNRFILQVDALVLGTFELSVDGRPLGRFSSRRLAEGLDLSLTTEHPDWIQAEQCVAWNAERSGLIRAGIRDIWEARRVLTKLKKEGSSGTPSFLVTQKRLKTLENNVGHVGRKVKDLEKKIREGIQPRWHSYSLQYLPSPKEG